MATKFIEDEVKFSLHDDHDDGDDTDVDDDDEQGRIIGFR